MEYRLAKQDDEKRIYEIVQHTIRKIYPKFYLPQIVDSFSGFHNQEAIRNDIENRNTYVLLENGEIIGTGTKVENHILRVYVLPEFQGKGYGTYIMSQLEKEIAKNYEKVELDASLSACKLYYNLGYRTVKHGIWECADGVLQVYEIMEKELKKDLALRLRPYKPSDAKTIISWIQDEDIFRKWSADRYDNYPITEEDMNYKYLKCNGDCPDRDNFYPMTAFDESGIMGHLILRFTDEEKQTLRFVFVIVNDRIRGKGYGKKMLQLTLRYAFDILKVKKVTLGVLENNPEAYHCYKAAGFQEVEMKEEIYYDLMGKRWKCIEMEINQQ